MKGIKDLIKHSSNYVEGLAAAPGIEIGPAFLYQKDILSIESGLIDNTDEALQNFDEAILRSKKELNKIFQFAKEKMGETRADIFEAQLMILDDPILMKSIKDQIIKEKKLPEYIVHKEITKYQELMVISSELYMRERAIDIEDIKARIIRNLQKKRLQSKVQHNSIIVGESISPADTILFAKSEVCGYVVDHGGLTSHAAIIARSLDIPAVVGTHFASHKIKTGDILIIDGFHGYVFINPTEDQLKYYKNKIDNLKKINIELVGLKDKPAETTDGRNISIMANVDVSGEIDTVVTKGAHGIGLYRTEQIIEELGSFPDEEEQYNIYSGLANRIYPDFITIRAFDTGGDKVKMMDFKEANPFLGLRGIRFLLENENVFKAQIRAVLRASINKNIQFMIPMISTLQEIKRVKELVNICRNELSIQKINYDKHIKIGIMVEVPSAAVMAGEYARHVDFISIGTNDLIQYLLAVDRGNDVVSALYQEFHPSVIRSLNHIISEAKKSGKPVSICGEMAADTLAVPLLVGMGIDIISVSPSAIPSIKRTIRSFSLKNAESLVNECLASDNEEEIQELIKKFFKENSIQRTRNII
ncbi:MAG: phosphoenolpyruvate--protein phosphotransferase [Ignavibacteriaceae bacterium]|nr:phosphoenolpyruvate--protein phosphotransferase [Ignavibacteriaceae bacterium]